MSELKPLVIGDLVVEKPIIQGGMGVGISLHRLAGAVAKAGGMGIISAAQIGFREPDFTTNFVEANLRSIRREMKLAREIAPQGAIGFNIMVATKHYDMWVKEAVKAGADIVISGAGLPVSLPEYVEAAYAEMEEKPARRIKLAPIVSSAKSAMVICKMWDRKCHIAPDWFTTGKTADGLIHNSLENGCCQVRLGCTFVDQGLNVGFGKYTATGSDRIDGIVVLGIFVKTGSICL